MEDFSRSEISWKRLIFSRRKFSHPLTFDSAAFRSDCVRGERQLILYRITSIINIEWRKKIMFQFIFRRFHISSENEMEWNSVSVFFSLKKILTNTIKYLITFSDVFPFNILVENSHSKRKKLKKLPIWQFNYYILAAW